MDEATAKASSEESKLFASNKDYQFSAFKMDVQNEKSVQDMVDFVINEYGRLDYAVNAAGVSKAIPVRVVLNAQVLMCKYFELGR
jgi:NAD(P)-dependent dehydrogenase (short-subunit alcohol dehydrogenase family)